MTEENKSKSCDVLTEEHWRTFVIRSLEEGERRMDRIECSMRSNTALTQDIKTDTSEFLEVFKAMKGGFKVLGWLGTFAKWAASLGAAIAGLYFALKGGGPHP